MSRFQIDHHVFFFVRFSSGVLTLFFLLMEKCQNYPAKSGLLTNVTIREHVAVFCHSSPAIICFVLVMNRGCGQ